MQLSAKALLKPFSHTTTDHDEDISEFIFDNNNAPIPENISDDEQEEDAEVEDEGKDDNESDTEGEDEVEETEELLTNTAVVRVTLDKVRHLFRLPVHH